MTVDVEILCVGNELLIGKIDNTNAHWLAKKTTTLGANVKRITVIPDEIDEIAGYILESKKRKPKFVIITGGLGPTFDDKTFQGIAKALDQKLIVNQSALKMVQQRCIEYYKKNQISTKVEMTPPRIKMATFPEKTTPVVNPIGTAPALRADFFGIVLFALPGVPVEVKAIFEQTIQSIIKRVVGTTVFYDQSIFVENIMESQLAPLIDQVMKDNSEIYIKSHPMKSYIEIHLSTLTKKEQKPDQILENALKQLVTLVKVVGGIVRNQNTG